MKAVVTYGHGFFSRGDEVYFVKKSEKKGRVIRKKTGIGTVASVESDTSTVSVDKGIAGEGYEIVLKNDDTESQGADLCPDCDGKRTIRTEVKCGDCNGQGKLWHIKGRYRSLKPCAACRGKGTRRVEEPCETCRGSGRAR